MGLETSTFLDGLDETWPTGGDPTNKGDDHIRLLKAVLKTTFPGANLNGFEKAITASEDELNFVDGVTSAIQTQLDNIVAQDGLSAVPIGGVIMFNGAFAGIPANYQLCDGTNGTADMTDKFVYGTNTELELLDTGGSNDAVVVDHNHTGTTNNDGNHTHSIPLKEESGNNAIAQTGKSIAASETGTTTGTGAHNHGFTTANSGVSGVDANRPAFVKLAYIQRMT